MKLACLLTSLLGLFLTIAALAHGQPISAEPVGDDTTGFTAIFDGRTLTNWEADPKYWHVENGALVGVVTSETPLKANSFAIWRGGMPADFELKVQYRISASGNSGINYRSAQMQAPTFALKGYQADIDGANQWTGQNYEERGRAFLALRGQVTRVVPGGKVVVVGTVGDKDALTAFVNTANWNQVHLIARGNVLTHLINGHVMSVMVDEDPVNRTAAGLIGVQVHVGPPMKVEFRNFLLKPLTAIESTNTTVKSNTP